MTTRAFLTAQGRSGDPARKRSSRRLLVEAVGPPCPGQPRRHHRRRGEQPRRLARSRQRREPRLRHFVVGEGCAELRQRRP